MRANSLEESHTFMTRDRKKGQTQPLDRLRLWASCFVFPAHCSVITSTPINCPTLRTCLLLTSGERGQWELQCLNEAVMRRLMVLGRLADCSLDQELGLRAGICWGCSWSKWFSHAQKSSSILLLVAGAIPLKITSLAVLLGEERFFSCVRILEETNRKQLSFIYF